MAHYQHSGKVSLVGIVLAALLLLPVAVIGGSLYSAAMVFVPYVKLRALVCILFTGGLGTTIGKICSFAKFRNRWFTGLVTLGAIAATLYSSWAMHPFMMVASDAGFNAAWAEIGLFGFLPSSVIGWATMMFNEGIWAMGGGEPTKGGWIASVWIAEALCFLVAGWVMAETAFGDRPFCEFCNVWTEREQGVANMPVSAEDPSWAEIDAGDLDALRRLKIAPVEGKSVRIDMAQCPKCDQSDFMLASDVTWTVDDEGNVSSEDEPIVHYLQVDRAQANDVRAFAEELNAAVELMEQEEDAENDTGADVEDNSDSDESPR